MVGYAQVYDEEARSERGSGSPDLRGYHRNSAVWVVDRSVNDGSIVAPSDRTVPTATLSRLGGLKPGTLQRNRSACLSAPLLRPVRVIRRIAPFADMMSFLTACCAVGEEGRRGAGFCGELMAALGARRCAFTDSRTNRWAKTCMGETPVASSMRNNRRRHERW